MWRLRSHRDHSGDHAQAADGIDQVGGAQPGHSDQHAAERRSQHHRELVEAEVEREGSAQAPGLDDIRDDRAAGDVLDRAEARQQAAEHIEGEQRRVPEEGAGAQCRGDDHQRELVDQEQPTSVHAIGERAAVERHGHQRKQLDGPQQAGQQR